MSVDWQKIKIQELEADHSVRGLPFAPCCACRVTGVLPLLLLQDPGRIPRTIECELTQDLVDSCVPGDLVTVAGIVKAVNTEVAAGRGTARARSLFLLYVDATSVSSVRLSKGSLKASKQVPSKPCWRSVCVCP